MNVALRSLGASLVLGILACRNASEPPPRRSPSEVTARYTGELNVRGSYGYTSTWGTRSNPDGSNVRGNAVYLLLAGGDKRSQKRDILAALELAKLERE